MHTSFSIEAAFKYGWNTFKHRPGFFIGMTVIILLVSWVTGFVLGMVGEKGNAISGIINLLVTTLVDLGVVATMLKVFDAPDSVTFSDLWHPQRYVPYLLATVLTGVFVVAALAVLPVVALTLIGTTHPSLPVMLMLAVLGAPGVYVAMVFLFVKFIVVDRHLGPVEALKESARITNGHRLVLFLFVLAIAIINVVAAIVVLVPLLVTIPISSLAMVYAYRTLGHKASEVVPAPAH